MNNAPIAALEIGTTHTRIAIGEPLPNGRIRVRTVCSIPSQGVRKSQITEIEHVRYSLDSMQKTLSKQKNFSIGEAYLAVSGPQIRAQEISASVPIPTGIVRDEDTDALYNKLVDNADLMTDRKTLELSPLGYKIDDLTHVSSPRGINGRLLAQTALCIHGDANRIADAHTAADAAHLQIIADDYYFAGSCAAAAVLTPQQKRDGALVIDLGGGSTTYVVWSEGSLVLAGVLGVGGDHLSNDLRAAFSLTKNQANALKETHGSALVSLADAGRRVQIAEHMLAGAQTGSVSQRALNTVINARMQEIFDYILEKLDEAGLQHAINAGVFLTGGGAALKDVNKLAETVFGCTAQTGHLIPEIEWAEEDFGPASHEVVAGLLLLAHQQNAPKPSVLDNIAQFFKGIFRK